VPKSRRNTHDTCFDGDVGQALARASESTRIAAYWQSVIWNRKVVDFAIGFGLARSEYPPGSDWFEHVNPTGRWPHDALVVPSPSATHDAVAPDALAADAIASDGVDLAQ